MRFSVIGDGAMGLACALLLERANPTAEITIWCRLEDTARELTAMRRSERYLPSAKLSPRWTFTSDPCLASECDAAVVAVPTIYLSETLARFAPAANRFASRPILSVVKGVEQETFRRPSEIIAHALGDPPVVVLSGPSHAEELAADLPASVTAAGEDVELVERVQTWFTSDRFRVYTWHDPVGAELAGALKNVVAIAAGICDGLKLGDNAKSALLARALMEMIRFGKHHGADERTFFGLAGLGDLVTTCVSPHGRNRRLGIALGEGQSLRDILASTHQVTEGVWTARGVHHMAERDGIDMPVCREVYSVLFEEKNIRDAVDALMSREPKREMAVDAVS